MTAEQAQHLVTRIMARFPRGYRDPETLGAWADEFQRWPYSQAVEAITPMVRAHSGEWPPPLNAIKDVVLRARERGEKAEERARLPPPADPSHRATMARKTRLVVDYLLEHGTGPLGGNGRKWHPHITPAEYHAARNAGESRPGSRRTHEICRERYGHGWDDPANWGQDERGRVVPPGHLPAVK